MVQELAIANENRPQAANILRAAQEMDVPIRPDLELAGALLDLNLGMSIPPELFRAIAETLAFLAKLNQ